MLNEIFDNLRFLFAPLMLLALLGGAIGAWLVGRQSTAIRHYAHWPVWIGTSLALLFAVGIWGSVSGQFDRLSQHATGDSHAAVSVAASLSYAYFTWISTGMGPDVGSIGMTFQIDALTVVMLLTVLIVGLPIAIYSQGYMAGDSGYGRFFFAVGLFLFSMCVLVLAGNFLVLYLGWELVGLCSYLLIGHYQQKDSARAAAMKAFVVNRIGDLGFLLGILLLWYHLGSLEFSQVLTAEAAAKLWNAGVLTPVCLLLLCGAVGKSAQFPLFVWLPDAMEGPSPVSALIHAATMVTAGVYLVARCGVLFAYAGPSDPLGHAGMSMPMMVVTGIGLFSAVFAAVCACAQYDLKRILAFSTMSQLGLMFVALGCGRPDSAIFHLHTHAFFKALLFLAAGAVLHAMHHVVDIRQLGGLRRRLPVVFWSFVFGGAALAGFPLLSGFFSKDEIVLAAYSASPLLGLAVLAVSLTTAFYTFRMVFWAFLGEEKLPAAVMHGGKPHIVMPSMSMTVALVILLVGAVFAGYVGVGGASDHAFVGLFTPGAESVGKYAHEGLSPSPLHQFLYGGLAVSRVTFADALWLMYVSAGLSVVGIAAAWVLYAGSRQLATRLQTALGPVYTLAHRRFYVDEAYDRALVRPGAKVGRFNDLIDTWGIHLFVEILSWTPRVVGYLLRSLQGGRMPAYTLAIGVSMVLLLLLVVPGLSRPPMMVP